jgi:nucleoid-associated protein YgaU
MLQCKASTQADWPSKQPLAKLHQSGVSMTKIGYGIIAIVIGLVGAISYWVLPDLLGPPAELRPQAVSTPSGASQSPTPAPSTPTSNTPPPSAAPLKAEAAKPVLPRFDVVRVEPNGEIVVAGRAAPDAMIVLLRGPNSHATAKADAQGQFAMAPDPLPPGDHELRLLATDASGSVRSEQSVFVSVAGQAKRDAVVALQTPASPTVNLNPAQTAQANQAQVSIFAVDVLSTGLVAASGAAQPGAEIRLYLNDTFIATAKAGERGAWSLTIEKGVTPGLYRLRADEMGADGKVRSRAEVQFEVPNVQASAPPAPSHAAAVTPAQTGPANVVIESVQTATVIKGDSLWRISEKIYGHGTRYTIIHGANSDQIRDPDLIYPGQVFVLPTHRP